MNFWRTTLKIFNVADFGIVPNEDISEKLAEFISALKAEDGETTAVFDSKRCKDICSLSPTPPGKRSFCPTKRRISTPFRSISAACRILLFDGGDSIFVIDGKVTNIAVEDCRNITLRNLEIRHARPDMHEFLVVRKSAFSVDFKIDSDSSFSFYALLC